MSEYKYYDYLKKYNPRFLNNYESWSHINWSRRSGFIELLNYRSYTLSTGRNILFDGLKLKGWFFVYGSLMCIMDIWGVWYFQDIHQKYSTRKWVYYQPYMKPEMTFIEYIII